MNSKKWLLLVMCALMVLLFVGCEAAEAVPQPRDLVVVNGTTDAQIVSIGITPFPFGQRASLSSGTFYMYDEDALEVGDEFSIVLSPYIYRVVVDVKAEYIVVDPATEIETTQYDRMTAILDFPEVSESQVVVTVIDNDDEEYPRYTFAITGDYAAYDVPDVS